MDEKIKTWPLCFPAKENSNMKKTLFDWPIVLQFDVKTKYRLISRKFTGMKFFHPSVRLTNQKSRAFCIRSINQSNRSISVRLLFLFCSRVFISRSCENRSIREWLELGACGLQVRRSNRSATLPPQKRSKCRDQSLISPWNSFYLACPRSSP